MSAQIPGMQSTGFFSGGMSPGGTPTIGAIPLANLPPASQYQYYTALITDYGVNLVVRSDGTRWLPDGPQVLGRSAVAATAPLNTNPNTLATVAVPPGLLGLNGSLRVWSGWKFTSSANGKTFTTSYGGTTLFQAGIASAGVITARTVAIISNRGVANSQSGGADDYGIGNGTVDYTAAINSAVAQNLLIVGTKGLAGEELTLNKYLVEILP